MDQADNRIYREKADRASGSGPAFPVNDQGLAHLVGVAAIDGITDPAERDRLYVEARARAVSGMTLRDYFAAKALPTLLDICRLDLRDEGVSLLDHVAENAYAVADAMLAARDA
jgi:hypothetical protein